MTLAAEILADSPVGYWPLDETSGTTAVDASGHSHDGTFHGGIAPSTGGPAGLRCLTFDGVAGSYIDVPSSAAFASHAGGAGVWSYEMWLYRALATTEKCFFSRGVGGSAYEWLFEVDATDTFDEYMITTGGSTVERVHAGSSLLNQWQHVAGTFDRAAQTFILYLNGVEAARASSASGNTSDSSGAVYLGTRNDALSSTYCWNGRIAQAAVYGSVLSPARILARYEALFPPARASDRSSTRGLSRGVARGVS